MKWLCIVKTSQLINLADVKSIVVEDAEVVALHFNGNTTVIAATVAQGAAEALIPLLAQYLNECDVLTVKNISNEAIELHPKVN